MRTPLSVLCMLILAVATAHTLSAVAQTGPGSGSAGGAAGANINSAGTYTPPTQGGAPVTSPGNSGPGNSGMTQNNTAEPKDTGVGVNAGVYNGKAGVNASSNANLRRRNTTGNSQPYGAQSQTGIGVNAGAGVNAGGGAGGGGTMNPSAPMNTR